MFHVSVSSGLDCTKNAPATWFRPSASRQCESQPPSHQDNSDTWLQPSASRQGECQTLIALGNCRTSGSGTVFAGFDGIRSCPSTVVQMRRFQASKNPGGGLKHASRRGFKHAADHHRSTNRTSTLLICSCCNLIQLSSLSRPSSSKKTRVFQRCCASEGSLVSDLTKELREAKVEEDIRKEIMRSLRTTLPRVALKRSKRWKSCRTRRRPHPQL